MGIGDTHQTQDAPDGSVRGGATKGTADAREPGYYWVVFFNNFETEPAWWTGEKWLRVGEGDRIGGSYATVIGPCDVPRLTAPSAPPPVPPRSVR